MSDENAYFNYGFMQGVNRELRPAIEREMKIVTDKWKAHSEQLEQTNQKNLYYLGSALGAASEERMGKLALAAYIGSIFSVLNKTLGKEAVRNMLSLDRPEMERALKEKLAEVEEWIKDGGALDGVVKADVKNILKSESIKRGYQETIDLYGKGVGRSISHEQPPSQGIGFEMDMLGAKSLIQRAENSRMSS